MPLDLERARLLLVWLQARRELDRLLAELLAAGPAGEQRVRARLDLVTGLEVRAHRAFEAYRKAVETAGEASAAGPRLSAVPTDETS